MNRKAKRDSSHILKDLRSLAVPINSVKPDPANDRLHPERNLEAIRASIKRYGQRKPIVVNRRTKVIEAGSGTWEAMRAEGYASIAAVFVSDDHTTARGYAIADNRTSELAEWDPVRLAKDLEVLRDMAELPNLGFEDQELNDLLRSLVPPKEETFNVAEALAAAPELAERVKLDQVWQLGKHRLMCGDSTKAENVSQLLGGAMPTLMVTDPPYGVEYDPAWRNEAAAAGYLAYADRRVGEISHDDRVDWREAWMLFPGGVLYCWHADRRASEVQRSLEAAGFEIRCQGKSPLMKMSLEA